MKKCITVLLYATLAVATLFAVELDKNFAAEIKKMYPEAAAFSEIKANIFAVKNQKGQVIGKIYTEAAADFQRKFGYADTIEIAVVTDNSDKVTGVLIGKNNETPRWLDRVRKAGFLKQWNKLHLRDAADKKVDAVTGATMSSEAIAHGVRQIAQSAYNKPLQSENAGYTASEIKRLQNLSKLLSMQLKRSGDMRKQLKERKNDVLELNLIAATKDSEAASAFAKSKNLLYFARRPRHNRRSGNRGNAHHHAPLQVSAVDAAAKTYKAAPTAENLAALKKAIESDYLRQLNAPVSPREQNMQRRLEKINAQISALQKHGKNK